MIVPSGNDEAKPFGWDIASDFIQCFDGVGWVLGRVSGPICYATYEQRFFLFPEQIEEETEAQW